MELREENDSENGSTSEPIDVSLKDIYPQVWITIVCALVAVYGGMFSAFTNLLDEDNDVKSNIATLSSLAMIPGSLIVGVILDRIGRRNTILWIGFIKTLPWILVLFNDFHKAFLYAGFIIMGLGRGATTSAINVVITEVTHKKFRPLFNVAAVCSFRVGLLMIGLGSLMPWKMFSICSFVVAVIILIMAYNFLIESPMWLADIKLDLGKAKMCSAKLNPNKRIHEEYWNDLLLHHTNQVETDINKDTSLASRLGDPSLYRPVLTCTVLITLTNLSGIGTMVFYLVNIIRSLAPKFGPTHISEMLISITALKLLVGVSVVVASYYIKFNKMLYTAVSFNCLTALIITVCSTVSATSTWIEILVIVSFCVYFSIGRGMVYSLNSDLMPTYARGTFTPLFNCLHYALQAIFTKVFPHLLETISLTYIFGFFFVVSALTIFCIHFYVPEIRNRTVHDIEKYFAKTQHKTEDEIKT